MEVTPRFWWPELALDDVQRHAFARELDRVRVPELVRREAPLHAGAGRARVERFAGGAGGPGASAGAAIEYAEEWATRIFWQASSQGWTCSKPQTCMPISRRRPPLPRRTRTDPLRGSRSSSVNESASLRIAAGAQLRRSANARLVLVHKGSSSWGAERRSLFAIACGAKQARDLP
jgi:hypothetical protein